MRSRIESPATATPAPADTRATDALRPLAIPRSVLANALDSACATRSVDRAPHRSLRALLDRGRRDQRDRVRDPVRDRRLDHRLLDRRVHRRRDPELDVQPPLDVEGRGPDRVRARGLRLRGRLGVDAVHHFARDGLDPAPRAEHPRRPRHPRAAGHRLLLGRVRGPVRGRFFLYELWIFSGRSRVRAAFRSRLQVWNAARANRTP